MVRHGSAKPLSPSSNLGGASKEKSTPFGVLFSFLWMRYSRFELGSRRAKRKRTGSHTPLEVLKACFQGAERGYLRRANTWVASTPFGVLFSFLWMRYSRFELGSRRAKRKRTGSHTPLEVLKACFQGAERGYLRRANTWVASTPFGVLFSFLWMRYSRFELGSRRAKRKRTGSHTPLEVLKACFQGLKNTENSAIMKPEERRI